MVSVARAAGRSRAEREPRGEEPARATTRPVPVAGWVSTADSRARVTVVPTATTRPPSRAMREAVARPIPEAAPVTTAVRPANRSR